MRKYLGFVCVLAMSSGALLLACTTDDTTDVPADGGAHDATFDVHAPLGDSSIPPEAGADSSAGDDAGDAAIDTGLTGHLLVTYGFDNYQKSEYAAFDLASASITGHLQFSAYGTNVFGGAHEWVLDQAGDVVHEMSASDLVTEIASWTVAEPKQNDAGSSNSDPWSLVEVGTKAYVTLFNRNVIAVLDTSVAADGGAPTKTIDLSGLVQAGDSDGYVDQGQAVYDSANHRLYVLLSNIDLNNVDPHGFFEICSPTLRSTVIAIDTTNDTLVQLSDAGPGGGIPLHGVQPQMAALDSANNRLVVLSNGCNKPADGGADAGKGPLVGRLVEGVDLASGTSQVLLDATSQEFPGQLAYVDDHHALVSFGGVTYRWDPGVSSLGAPFATAPDSFALDGHGHMVGPMSSYLSDGGYGGVSVVSVDTNDGGVVTIDVAPVTTPDPTGYFEGVDFKALPLPSPP